MSKLDQGKFKYIQTLHGSGYCSTNVGTDFLQAVKMHDCTWKHDIWKVSQYKCEKQQKFGATGDLNIQC